MPVTRRSSGRPAAKQSTLSFNHRVTKSSLPKNAKAAKKESPLSAKASPPPPATKDVPVDDEPEEDVQQEEKQEKTEAEQRAAQLTDRQVDAYWRRLERERKAKRVHQEDLSVAEKVLRYWDVSSQYGPCVGISRLKRWQRADRLGLNPPPEVLAVLMKEEAKGAQGIEKAHMDEILNSTAVAGA
ncbi:hypothetical protein F4780DRAFT_754218 [Xylariomycetidae sp. FL0641]|nr:hypothetical protein F4780DRAFT_754218 [Xylariomycetidae sp. FL0641]